MTSPLNPSPTVLQNYEGTGVPDESVGFVLQRGGEELLLSKASDRFTVRVSSLTTVAQILPQIPGKLCRTLLQNNLEEFTIEPAQRDQAMQVARTLNNVAFASHVYHPENNPATLFYLTDEITVQFGENVEAAAREAIASYTKLKIIRPLTGVLNAFVCQVTKEATENPLKIANRLTRYREVLLAEPNISVQAQQHYTPRDSLYIKQWYLNNKGGNQLGAGSHIFAEQAWDITRGNRSVIIAIADDSVDINHPDFKGQGKIVSPLDLKDNDFSPMPVEESDNHGTSCAGVATAEENGIGIVGVAPGCALMPIRTTGYLDDDSIEQIFDWVIQKGAAVVSCSWGPSAVYFPLSLRQSAALTKAATQGRNGKGCVIVFAAGNANRPVNGTINEKGWPKNIISGQTKWLGGFTVHPDVITVAASTSLGKKAAYSNWGSGISVCAPSNNAPPGMWLQETGFVSTPPEVTTSLLGLGVFTADRIGAEGYDPGDYTGYFGGTSSATPVVAGVAALILSANPNLTAREVRTILEQTADKIVDTDPDPQFGTRMGTYSSSGRCDWFGYGKVNAFKAVQAAVKGSAGGAARGLSDIGGHWAQTFIERLIAANMISGFPDGTFKPDDFLTRVQYAALLAKAFTLTPRLPATNFVDVSASFWGRDAILKANQAGFLAGFPGLKFMPNQYLTRVEAIVSLMNGLQLSGGNINSLNVYSDRAQIPYYADRAVATATDKKIVVNFPDRTRLLPLKSITRAEISALIYQTLVATNRAKAINSPYIV
ncbi:peptidase S8 [Oscillatoriales cyanobacterium USR001]|nr:peptidase S8 [Oscillatoriales cyanobacterium USR001]